MAFLALFSIYIGKKTKQPDFLVCILLGIAASLIFTTFMSEVVVHKKEALSPFLYAGKFILCWYIFLMGKEHVDFENFNIKRPIFSFLSCFIISCLAASLFVSFKPPEVALWHYSLIIGLALSITALPVLTRILETFSIINSPLGRKALNWTIVNDLMVFICMPFFISDWSLQSIILNASIFIICFMVFKNKKILSLIENRCPTEIGGYVFVSLMGLFVILDYFHFPLLSLVFVLGFLFRKSHIKVKTEPLLKILPLYFVAVGFMIEIKATTFQWDLLILLILASIGIKILTTYFWDTDRNDQTSKVSIWHKTILF